MRVDQLQKLAVQLEGHLEGLLAHVHNQSRQTFPEELSLPALKFLALMQQGMSEEQYRQQFPNEYAAMEAIVYDEETLAKRRLRRLEQHQKIIGRSDRHEKAPVAK